MVNEVKTAVHFERKRKKRNDHPNTTHERYPYGPFCFFGQMPLFKNVQDLIPYNKAPFSFLIQTLIYNPIISIRNFQKFLAIFPDFTFFDSNITL